MDLNKVRPGDPLRIPARTWNAVLDATIGSRGQTPGRSDRGKREKEFNPGVVLVKNVSGAALARWSCVEISDTIVVPDNADAAADQTKEFQRYIALKGTTPAKAGNPWAILQQPLDINALGPAVISGITICRINLAAATDTAVESASGLTLPQSGTSGTAQIVRIAGGVGSASATGEQWAVIRIGGGGSAAEPSGIYLGSVRQVVAANTDGYDFVRATSLI